MLFVVSTAGQGEFPMNCREFWKALQASSTGLNNTRYECLLQNNSPYLPAFPYRGQGLSQHQTHTGFNPSFPLHMLVLRTHLTLIDTHRTHASNSRARKPHTIVPQEYNSQTSPHTHAYTHTTLIRTHAHSHLPRYAMFAMGDSHYWPRPDEKIYFAKSGKDLDERLEVMGAQRLTPCGIGDDQVRCMLSLVARTLLFNHLHMCRPLACVCMQRIRMYLCNDDDSSSTQPIIFRIGTNTFDSVKAAKHSLAGVRLSLPLAAC